MGDQGITAKELHQLFVILDAQVQPVPPQLREIAEAVLFAEDEVSVGNYSAARTRVANILNKYPFDSDVWKKLDATNPEVNLARPNFYNNFRILDEITSVALNSPAATSRRLNMTVIMQRYSRFQVPEARGGGWITAEIDQTQKTKDYSDYRQFLNLFRRYIWAITDGQLELNVRFYEVQNMFDYTYDLASNTLVRGSYSQPLSNLPAEIRNTTDFFWTVWPDYPTDPKLDGITINAPEGMGGYQHSGSSYISPHFLSHDTATGKYSISSSYMTRRAWGPEWLQHEFFHHLFNIFPEYGLENSSHQWFSSSNWPADFVQGFEEDYYAESLKKRLRGSVPSIAARLKTAPVSELTNPGNAAPVVNAGTYTPVALTGATVVVSLDGTVTDSDTTAVVTNWSKVNGPGTVVFNNSSAVDTTATFSRPGNYVLSLSADDGLARTSSLATIQITSTNVIKYRLDVYGGTGGGEYAAGTQVMITADAAPMSQEFDKWLGNTSALANVNSASTTVTMPAADVIVTPSYTVLESSKEYVGYYEMTTITDPNWHRGWIEFSGKHLQWRNPGNSRWNLLPTAQADVFVTDATCPYGAGLNFTFARQNGRIVSFEYLGWGRIYYRHSPVALGASLFTLPNVSLPVTLTASDPQGNTMTYTVLAQPAHGTLSGTAPNLTYTPSTNFVGNDSFTFKANDGTNDSNIATISLTILPAVPPVVTNGAGVTSMSETSAILRGVLTTGGLANAWICWGSSDGGTTSTSGWAHVVSIGNVTQGIVFSNLVTGLATNTTYFYRCYATNAYGSDWSDTATTFNGTPVGGAGWTPSNLVMAAWYDASASNTVTASVGKVSRWADKSGSGNHATNGAAATQPGTGTRTIGGRNAIEFGLGGTKRFLAMSNSVDFVDRCVIGVFAIDTTGVSAQFIGSPDGSNKQIGYGTNRWRIAAAGNNWINGATGDVATTNTYDNAPHMVSYEGGSTLKFFIDGAQDLSTEGRENTAAYGLQTLGMFSPSASTAFFDGLMGELIILASIPSPGDRQMLEGYLAHKWGIASNLPSNHPYKSAAPGTASVPIANSAPTAISETAATLHASLGAAGTNYAVYVYYGTSDRGTNAGLWTSSAYVGSWTNVSTNVSYAVSGLTAGTQYYYTFVASNATGRAWASPSWTFQTLGAAPSVTVNHSVPHVWLAARNALWSNDYEAAATNDVDGDGFATWQEYWSGTDPQDSNSFLRIDSIGFSGTNLIFSWRHAFADTGIPPITIQVRTNLVSGSWVGIGSHVPTNGVNIWSAGSSVQGFYRLAVTNAP
jgi:hypothetical protein